MNKPKIAILFCGNINEKINSERIKAGWSLEKVVKITRFQFEHYYDVDYFCVFNQDFDKSIFDNKLKDYKIISDEYLYKYFDKNDKNLSSLKGKARSCPYQFHKRKYFIDFLEKYKDFYKFYIFKRSDTILVPNGFGLWDRNVNYNQTAGWKRINYLNDKYYKIHLKFKDNFDLNNLYIIPYYPKMELIWDGFCLGNYINMITYLKYIHIIIQPPEKQLLDYLNKNKIKIIDINYISDLKKIDNKLSMITDLRFGIHNSLEKYKNNNKLHLLF